MDRLLSDIRGGNKLRKQASEAASVEFSQLKRSSWAPLQALSKTLLDGLALAKRRATIAETSSKATMKVCLVQWHGTVDIHIDVW